MSSVQILSSDKHTYTNITHCFLFLFLLLSFNYNFNSYCSSCVNILNLIRRIVVAVLRFLFCFLFHFFVYGRFLRAHFSIAKKINKLTTKFLFIFQLLSIKFSFMFFCFFFFNLLRQLCLQCFIFVFLSTSSAL